MNCLLVDPSITMRRIISHILRSTGFESILEAGDMKDALQHCGDEGGGRIDLVITEWDLASGSGLDLVKEIRQKSDSSAIPILLLTTRNSREEVMMAIESGVDGYVLKPLSPGILRAKIDLAIQSRDQHAAQDESQPREAA
jgi:two-component system chemotaxis response regulator CheY